MKKLQDIFSQINYFGIEQITKGVYAKFDSSDHKEWQIADVKFGMSGLEYINECINLFIDSVKRRDEGFAESIKKEIDEIVFAIGNLKDLFSKKLSIYEYEVFVSYAWGGESESIVNDLEQAFDESSVLIVRDKKHVAYKDSIKTFEQRIGKGQRIILIISDKYLRSEHCMYELLEANENPNLRKRIFPIVLADACIYNPVDRLNYIKYWDEKVEKLDEAIKGVKTMTNLISISASLNRYARIRVSFDNLADLLADMNTLTPETHAANGFSALISAVERAIEISDVEAEQLKVLLKYIKVKVDEFKNYAKQLDEEYSE